MRFSRGQFNPSGQTSVAFVKAQLLLGNLLVSIIHCMMAAGQVQRRFCLTGYNQQMAKPLAHYLIHPKSSLLALLQGLNKSKLTNLCPKFLDNSGELPGHKCDISH